MKRGLTLIICIMFLTSFVIVAAASITGSATVDVSGQNKVQANTNAQIGAGDDINDSSNTEARSNKTIPPRVLSEYEIRTIKRIQNRLQANTDPANCPESCTCDGSTTKCELGNGTREMTIRAGKSGNIIVQVKNANMSTNVTLYKAQGKIYGVFRGNQTRVINVLPDQVQERIRERLKAMLQDENITLDENGTYQVQERKRARLFGLFPVRERVRIEMNSETGEITMIKNSWWGFLAKDVPEEQFVGGCGTVTPGLEDECCQNQGYDFWDAEAGECVFGE